MVGLYICMYIMQIAKIEIMNVAILDKCIKSNFHNEVVLQDLATWGEEGGGTFQL